MFENPTKPEIDAFLRRIRKIAILGVSETPGRPSHHVAEELQKFGYRIVPVNPMAREILGEKAYPDLESALQGAGPVDVVDVFRKPDAVDGIVPWTESSTTASG
jgi:predicted CoA-binding protein